MVVVMTAARLAGMMVMPSTMSTPTLTTAAVMMPASTSSSARRTSTTLPAAATSSVGEHTDGRGKCHEGKQQTGCKRGATHSGVPQRCVSVFEVWPTFNRISGRSKS